MSRVAPGPEGVGSTKNRKPPSPTMRVLFRIPVAIYRARLGFLFAGRVIAIVHRGRTSGRRYVSGLEVLDRTDDALFVLSAWGRRADWVRNIEANGVEALWDRRHRGPATHRIVGTDEAYHVLLRYETQHARAAKAILPRIAPGYDFTTAARRQLATQAAVVAFTPR